MKRAIIILGLLFFLSPTSIFASEIHGHFHTGYITELESFYTDIQIDYSFGLFRLDVLLTGGIETLMIPSKRSSFRFNPYRNTFYFGAELKVTNHLKIGWTHSCTHASWSYEKLFWDRFASGNRTSGYVGVEW